MDVYLVLILTFFAVLIGGIFWWSASSARARQGLPSLQLEMSPEAVVEMQLEEILESKSAAAQSGRSFHYEFAEKASYEELKRTITEGDSGVEVLNNKPLQSALLKRCIECLQATMSFDSRVKIVYESYNNLVPREVLQYLATVKTTLTEEIEAIKSEANALKEGWGQVVFNQAMDLTVGLQRRKEARAQAEEQKALEAANKEKEAAESVRLEKEVKLRQQREADQAYALLTGEKAPKHHSTSGKKGNVASKKK